MSGTTTPPLGIGTPQVPPALLSYLGKQSTDIFTATDVPKVLQWVKDQNLIPGTDPLSQFVNLITTGRIGNPSIAGTYSEAQFTAILTKQIGKPIGVALPAAGSEAGTGQNPISFDITRAIMFIGVILVGITLLLVGGIVTLRHRNA